MGRIITSSRLAVAGVEAARSRAIRAETSERFMMYLVNGTFGTTLSARSDSVGAVRGRLCAAAMLGVLVAASSARADDKPLDVKEPPFGFGDFTWTTGNNRQPASLLTTGPVTLSLIVDTYYLHQFRMPLDHTAFPSVMAPRSDQVALNMGSIGVDVTGLDGPIGRLFLHYGTITETLGGQDATTNQGYFLTKPAMQFIQQAAAGWHFHALHGANLELGIMPSPIGIETHVTEENWQYLKPFLSDSTPYYLAGVRGQLYPSDKVKLEAWLVNGWQTYGQWHEGPGGVYAIEWRPTERIVLHHDGYAGRDQQSDASAVRLWTNNFAQVQLLKQSGVPRSVALATSIDAGYETRAVVTNGLAGGGILAGRVEWTSQWMTTLRADFFYDRTQTFNAALPAGSPYTLPDPRPFLGTGGTATVDFWPSPWTVFRLEYMHRTSSVPYFSGSGGITGPGGVRATDATASTFTPDLRKSDDRLVFNVTLRL